MTELAQSDCWDPSASIVGRVKIVQAADIGVVREIRVVDGQRVKAGEPLIVLDPTMTEADAAQARESLFVAQVDRARAQALVDAAAGRQQCFANRPEPPRRSPP